MASGSTLYGIVTGYGGQDTQTVVLVVAIDPTTGNYTTVAETFLYVGSSATYDGISGFDQKNNRFYYATDFESSFVFGVDVSKQELLPPISIGSTSVSSIDWDGVNDQLLINGLFTDASQAVITVPFDDKPSYELVNFTTQGIAAQSTYIDWSTGLGTYYFVFFNLSEYYIGSFSLSNSQIITSIPLGCGAAFSPDYLFYDAKNAALFGLGYNSTEDDFKFFRIQKTKCTITDLGLPGIVTAATYDPTSNKMYLGYVDTSAMVIIVDTLAAKVVSQLRTDTVIEDIQVAYAI